MPAIFKLLVRIDKGKPKIMCRIKTVTKDISLAILLRALNIADDYEIFKTVCYEIRNLNSDEMKDIKGIL